VNSGRKRRCAREHEGVVVEGGSSEEGERVSTRRLYWVVSEVADTDIRKNICMEV